MIFWIFPNKNYILELLSVSVYNKNTVNGPVFRYQNGLTHFQMLRLFFCLKIEKVTKCIFSQKTGLKVPLCFSGFSTWQTDFWVLKRILQKSEFPRNSLSYCCICTIIERNSMRKLALSDEILLSVDKAARYIGGEVNSIMKDKDKVTTRVAFSFPDVCD